MTAPVSLPRLYTVPAGTKASVCNGPTCGARIWWITNPGTGRPLPIECDVVGGRRPSDTNDPTQIDVFAGNASVHDGCGVNHCLVCPDAAHFSGGSR